MGMATAEGNAKLHVPVSTLLLLQKQMRFLITTAVESGVPAFEVARMAGAEIRPFLDESIRDGIATPEEGLGDLLGAEGGCVSVASACKLFRKPKPVTRQTLTEQIRNGDVIAYRTGGGHYMVPVWQFRREGGVIEGLSRVLKAIREQIPGGGQLAPFTFFLQADPITSGRTPLEALKAGELEQTLEAVAGHIG